MTKVLAMKTFLFSFLLLSSQLFAQTKKDVYIELQGKVNDMGTINIKWADYPTDKAGNIDTLINYTKIDEMIKVSKKGKRITIINLLAQDGWALVSSVFVSEPELKGGMVYYYFKKTFAPETIK